MKPHAHRLRVLIFLAVVSALSIAASCHQHVKVATVGETAVVQAVHNVVVAEKAAYDAKAFDRDKHRKYLRAEQRILDGEAALNAALLAWAKNTDAGVPEQVKITSAALREIYDDVGTDFAPGTPLGKLFATLEAALNLLVPTR